MKKLVAMFLLAMSLQANAVELEGVKFDDAVKLEDAALTLNGAGVRSVAIFKMYAIGLYLAEKQHGGNTVLADAKAKRIDLHVLAKEAEMERFLNGFRKGITKNNNEAQLEALHERMAAFEKMFADIKTVKRGDTMVFDWRPASGTHVIFNGNELGVVGGEDFYRALLAIWIGEKPVKDNLKKALLGN